MLKRSRGLRLSTTKAAASLAWFIFSPSMLPEVSTTRMTSLATTASGFASTVGATNSRKKPSSPDSL